jgi:hypothetical protein
MKGTDMRAHFFLSLIKSFFRLTGSFAVFIMAIQAEPSHLINALMVLGLTFFIAELIGIAEELF